MVTTIQIICARLRAGSVTVGDGNHWPKHWPDAAPAVHRRRNALKSLVGPGVVSRVRQFNNLRCQTSLTVITGAKGIFLDCQTKQSSLFLRKQTFGGAI